jgi:DNA-binding MarR family transcriptional regulator
MSERRLYATEIQELLEEVVVTFRQLRVVSAEIHGDGAPMPGQRGVLIDLARLGPQTVAAMARTRGVSRQHLQVMVDGFRARGLVGLADNPAHRRSKLVRLTRSGELLVKTMAERESAALSALDIAIPSAQIRRATLVLRAVRRRLHDYPWARWREQASRAGEGRR